MHTILKKVKFRTLSPLIIRLLDLILGKRGTNNKNFPDPFFIIGSGRNGSTLLGAMLNNNNKLFLPPEQYVIGYSLLKWRLKRHKSWEYICDEIIGDYQLEKNTCNWNLSLEEVKNQMHNLPKDKRNFANIICALFNFYGQSKNSTFTLYGDQSPITTHFSKQLADEFPSSKFIVLVRDPRDVVLSYSKIKNHPANQLKYALWKWKDSIAMLDYLTNKNKENVHLVKYEKLVSEPQTVLMAICNFLSVKYDKTMLNTTNASELLGVSQLAIHTNLNNTINTSSIGKWKQELGKDDIKKINKETLDYRNRFGYTD